MDVPLQSNEDCIRPIQAIRGLYISSQGTATSQSKLAAEGITHIISILSNAELDRRQNVKDQSESKTITIEDNPYEDILTYLDEVHQWIHDALTANHQNRVLICSRRGTSRAGVFVVSYLMKSMSLPYSAALNLARVSHPHIKMNEGFEQQLRIYAHCDYDMFLPARSTPTSQAQSTGTEASSRKPKAAYKAWKAYAASRSRKSGSDVERERAVAMAKMAADLGRQRMAARNVTIAKAPLSVDSAATQSDGAPEDTVQAETNSDEEPGQQEQWRRVERWRKHGMRD